VTAPTIPTFVCCPECQSDLKAADNYFQCLQCNQQYPVTTSTQVDLRPKRQLKRTVSFKIDPNDPIWSGNLSGRNLRDLSVGGLEQILPQASSSEMLALEVGCGDRRSVRTMIEHAGYCWIGCDWGAQSAPYLADLHALPFRDDSFPMVISDAVLEHVRYPHIAIREMARVLRPGGVMVNEVAFLQPYHDSYYHMTHEGVIDLHRFAGLEVTKYGRGRTLALGYLGGRALGRFGWMVRPVDLAFQALAKRARATGGGGDLEICFACTVIISAIKR
jgi:SAM-dependent methyltransferase